MKNRIERGFAAIGILRGKTEQNFGTLIRSAVSFGANYVFTIGRRYKAQSSAVKLDRHIPIFHYETMKDFHNNLPINCRVVMVELSEKADNLVEFNHPERAVYLLGSEDNGIPKKLLDGFQVIQIPGAFCLNVAMAGTIVLYDRMFKRTNSRIASAETNAKQAIP